MAGESARNQPIGDSAAIAPSVLYKYCSPERIDILENLKIRFSPPSDFNDTFDSHYLVPKSQGPKGKVTRALLKNRLGIFCLTEQPNNLLMWVHYARNHTGFVLGFNPGDQFFQKDGRRFGKVIYEESPVVVSEPSAEVCIHKSRIWKYEEEWRCIREFEPKESRLIEIEPELITDIIFGSQMESWQTTRVMQYAHAWGLGAVRFQRSYALPQLWSFENGRKRMNVCDKCSGNGYLEEDYIP